MGAGGAVMLAGLGVHLFALEPVRDKLQTAQDMNDLVAWTANERKFDTRRTITLALYGVGAVAIAAGAILHVTVFKHTETALAIAPTSGGMMMSFEVRR